MTCLVPGGEPSGVYERGCAKARIASGTRFRARAVIEDHHPFVTYWPYIELHAPCTDACDAGQERCIATQTCLRAGAASCLFYEGRPQSMCACRVSCTASSADGTECAFDTSPDTMVSGVCSSGGCRGTR